MSPDLFYVLQREEPSETFIRREIEALRVIGIPVHVYSLAIPQVEHDVTPLLRRAFRRRLVERLFKPPFSPVYAARLLRNAPHALRLAATAARLPHPRFHAHFAWSAADAASLAAETLGIPWTCSVHAWDVFTRPSRETGARLASAAGVTACTERAADALRAAGIPEARIRVIRHGLDPAAFPFTVDRTDGTLPGRIAAVGRLVPKKGFDSLVDACVHLRKQGIPFTCTLVGDGPERRPLERQAAAGGILDLVTFTGWIDPNAAQRAIADATVLVHPSRRLDNNDSDGFANVLSEALFLGTPIITTPAGAATELLCECARIVPSDDPESLAAAITHLFRNPEACRSLAAAARHTAEIHLDQNRLIRELADFLNRE